MLGNLAGAYLDNWSRNELQHVPRVLDSVLPLLLSHDTRPKLCSLCVVVLLALVPVVALAADDVVRNLVWCLSDIWSELVREAVGRVLLFNVSCIRSRSAIPLTLFPAWLASTRMVPSKFKVA